MSEAHEEAELPGRPSALPSRRYGNETATASCSRQTQIVRLPQEKASRPACGRSPAMRLRVRSRSQTQTEQMQTLAQPVALESRTRYGNTNGLRFSATATGKVVLKPTKRGPPSPTRCCSPVILSKKYGAAA